MAYPDLILLEDHDGNFAAHLEAVYSCYTNEVVRAGLVFEGKRLSFKHVPATDGKGSAFWHAVQEEGVTNAEEDRTIDLRRCERIGWPAHMIANASPDGQGDVRWWKTNRNGRIRVVLWIPAEDYALVLEERVDHYMFWTTYIVRSGRAKQFARDHKAYWEI